MRALTIAVLIAINLTGCASKPTPAIYGNFIPPTAAADGKMMAEDVAKKLVALYPPASTRINLQQTTTDTFGAALVSALRTKGYALAEFKSQPAADGPVKTGDIAIAYLLDQPLDPGQYRVTVYINTQSISRIYQSKDGDTAPAGYWIRKE